MMWTVYILTIISSNKDFVGEERLQRGLYT